MRKIAIFGKGGIGKSTFTCNLAAAYARKGLRVLLVGCDPKHDTTMALTEGAPIRTAVEHSVFMDNGAGNASDLIVRGRLGIDCVEAGGPEPGIGCAGRGISRMVEILDLAGSLRADRYDVALFDVLGDVVCGGFAAPLREDMADQVVIVTSEELMSLYAANNVARAVRNYSANGAKLSGLVANLRDPDADRAAVSRFAGLLGAPVLAWLERDPAVRRAEYARNTVVEAAPQSAFARSVEALAGVLLADAGGVIPTPLTDIDFQELSRRAFVGATSKPVARRGEAAAASVTVHEESRDRDETGLARRHELLERALARLAAAPVRTGSSADQWGSDDQWRLFFCDRESKRNARTGLELLAPVLQIQHQDLECSFATPHWERVDQSYFNFPWLRKPERAQARRPGDLEPAPMPPSRMTDLRDDDAIHGGEKKLLEALKAGLENAEGLEAVVVHSTCVPTVIGDDVPKTMRAAAAGVSVPLIFSNPAGNQTVDVSRFILEKVLAEPGAAAVEPVPGSVNLIGFPEGPALDELCALLTEAGVSVNARVMPAITMAQARGLRRAAAQVFMPNAAYEPVYEAVFGSLGLPGHVFEPPYGVEGTRRWLCSVAALFGREREAQAAFERAFAPMSEDWRALRGKALGRTMAFVADASHLPRLRDARLFWGVPAVRVLREMGFKVEVLLHGASDQGPVKGFTTPADLTRLLSAADYGAVYSEFFYDERLVRAGKSQFSLAAFEPGLRGAAATLGRLLSAARWDFYRRYAPSLGGGKP